MKTNGKAATKPTGKKRREWKPQFLAALREWPSVSAAAQAAGINRSYAYDAYKRDEEFAQAWNEAEQTGISAVEDEAWSRTRKSDLMLIFMLKSRRRELYGEITRTEISGPSGGPIGITAIDYRDSLAALAPGPVPDSDASGQTEGMVGGPARGQIDSRRLPDDERAEAAR